VSTSAGRTPGKLHLTLPSATVQIERSQALAKNAFQDSMSQEHDMPVTEPSNRITANQVPVSLTYMHSQGVGQRQFQTIKQPPNVSSSSTLRVPGGYLGSQTKLGTQTPTLATQQMSKNLTIKHKQLAKAIK